MVFQKVDCEVDLMCKMPSFMHVARWMSFSHSHDQDLVVKYPSLAAQICLIPDTMVVCDQFVLCKAALIFAVTRWLLSFALNLLTSSLSLFSDSPTQTPSSPSSSCCSSSSTSSANLKIARDSLSLTTLGNIEHRLPESSDLSCAVCLNSLRKNSQVWELRNCCHVFHKHCLEKWLCYDNRLTCPSAGHRCSP
ncbi:UNVERIFIED_CONTAM: hypothetical protein Sradi_3380100 [Sesamum radiatum]|uniref:RING-type domain-containing protein n=1 Tax=Sesamum radiatum TaxID=300843 RepID=A0AAW2R436_SESRA